MLLGCDTKRTGCCGCCDGASVAADGGDDGTVWMGWKTQRFEPLPPRPVLIGVAAVAIAAPEVFGCACWFRNPGRLSRYPSSVSSSTSVVSFGTMNTIEV